jgi:hypothetical protein
MKLVEFAGRLAGKRWVVHMTVNSLWLTNGLSGEPMLVDRRGNVERLGGTEPEFFMDRWCVATTTVGDGGDTEAGG